MLEAKSRQIAKRQEALQRSPSTRDGCLEPIADDDPTLSGFGSKISHTGTFRMNVGESSSFAMQRSSDSLVRPRRSRNVQGTAGAVVATQKMENDGAGEIKPGVGEFKPVAESPDQTPDFDDTNNRSIASPDLDGSNHGGRDGRGSLDSLEDRGTPSPNPAAARGSYMSPTRSPSQAGDTYRFIKQQSTKLIGAGLSSPGPTQMSVGGQGVLKMSNGHQVSQPASQPASLSLPIPSLLSLVFDLSALSATRHSPRGMRHHNHHRLAALALRATMILTASCSPPTTTK